MSLPDTGGWRKLLATVIVLVFETGAFVLAVLLTKNADAGMLTAYFVAAGGTLSVYTMGNVVSKFSPPVEKPPEL